MEITEVINFLREFLVSETERKWFVDERTWLDGDWKAFQAGFDDCDADLLATELRNHKEDPGWKWWASLRAPEEENPLEFGVAALLPVMRFTREAAEAVLRGLDAGWGGHGEALIPTLVNRAGLKIEDIGGNGSFTPTKRVGYWYDRRTWHWRGPVEYVSGKLHFPVTRHQKSLAPNRIADRSVEGICQMPRMLYISPVGGAASRLLPDVLSCFLKAGADCLLIQYDEAQLELPDEVRVIRSRGYKWQLAIEHLHPDQVADYDYLFLWDDDLSVKNFDPLRFTRIMQINRLDMAQPSIQSSHPLSHEITQHRPCPPPRRGPNGTTSHRVVGRLTNFVEIMAPAFTREAWKEFYGYLEPENRSGWGYDYVPLGRKGVVDALPVVHTRAVQSINRESAQERNRFLDNQGWFRYAAVNQGWLFEPHEISAASSTS
jgi:hypothetical protein